MAGMVLPPLLPSVVHTQGSTGAAIKPLLPVPQPFKVAVNEIAVHVPGAAAAEPLITKLLRAVCLTHTITA